MENAQEQCSKHGRPNKEDKVTACRKIAQKLDLGTAHYQHLLLGRSPVVLSHLLASLRAGPFGPRIVFLNAPPVGPPVWEPQPTLPVGPKPFSFVALTRFVSCGALRAPHFFLNTPPVGPPAWEPQPTPPVGPKPCSFVALTRFASYGALRAPHFLFKHTSCWAAGLGTPANTSC